MRRVIWYNAVRRVMGTGCWPGAMRSLRMGLGQHGLNPRPISCSQVTSVRASLVGPHATTASRSTKVLAICTRLNVTRGAPLPCGPGRASPPAM
jgi:hypothetical protein